MTNVGSVDIQFNANNIDKTLQQVRELAAELEKIQKIRINIGGTTQQVNTILRSNEKIRIEQEKAALKQAELQKKAEIDAANSQEKIKQIQQKGIQDRLSAEQKYFNDLQALSQKDVQKRQQLNQKFNQDMATMRAKEAADVRHIQDGVAAYEEKLKEPRPEEPKARVEEF